MPSTKQSRRHERTAQYGSPMYAELMVRLRANLRLLRRKRGWTQRIAAEQCGMIFQTYQPIESGKVNVTMTSLARLAEAFGVDPVVLLAPVLKGGQDPSKDALDSEKDAFTT